MRGENEENVLHFCVFVQLEKHLSATHVSSALHRKPRCIINLKWQKNDVDKLHKQKEAERGGEKKAYHSHESQEKCVVIFSTPNSGRRG